MFPILYGKSKSGKIKSWSISVSMINNIPSTCVRHGYKNGLMIEKITQTLKGKNLGKKNATTPYDQAVLEAKAKWVKKIEEGYTETEENIKTILLPMLAHPYDKYKHKLDYPCYIQPKKDGIRCIYDGEKLYTRTGKVINNINFILDDLKKISNLSNSSIFLDGEIIIEDIPFQTFTGLINKKKLDENDKKILIKTKFYVFDTIMISTSFHDRLNILKNLPFKNNIILLETKQIFSEKELFLNHARYINEGNEGTIIRNSDAVYEIGFRSFNLLKYKDFIDEEFEIISYTEGSGKEKGCIIWICKTEKGTVFNVRPKGSYEERKLLFKNGEKYIGKMLTVRFQNTFDNELENLRFAVGVAIRDYE